jgi:hypothetical protein
MLPRQRALRFGNSMTTAPPSTARRRARRGVVGSSSVSIFTFTLRLSHLAHRSIRRSSKSPSVVRGPTCLVETKYATGSGALCEHLRQIAVICQCGGTSASLIPRSCPRPSTSAMMRTIRELDQQESSPGIYAPSPDGAAAFDWYRPAGRPARIKTLRVPQLGHEQMSRLLLAFGVIAVVAAGLAFTKPGRSVLASFGLVGACSSSDGCEN